MYKVLIGNKCEMAENRQVTTEEGRNLAEENEMTFLETSAKTGENVFEIFSKASQRILNDISNKKIDPNVDSLGI